VIEKTLNILATVALIIASSIISWKFIYPQQAAGVQQPPPAVEQIDQKIEVDAQQHTFGTGRIAVIEFTDYECPYCKLFAQSELSVLKRDFSNKISFYSYNFPLSIHAQAEGAARAAVCASWQEKLGDMHDKLFSSPLSQDVYSTYAVQIGLDTKQFSSCMTTDLSQTAINNHKKIGDFLRVQGTPSFFVGTIAGDGRTVQLKSRVADRSKLVSEIQRLAAISAASVRANNGR